MRGPVGWLRTLQYNGVLGMNQRNAEFILPNNPRSNYPRVDDKLLTKQLAQSAGIPVPELLGVVSFHHEMRDLRRLLEGLPQFVLKPTRGAQGNGIVVITGAEAGGYRKSSGRVLSYDQLRQHVSSTISGVFSLRGDADRCLIEARVVIDPRFEAISRFGIPDVRVIVYRGVPVMAMCRLPTAASDGRANLHQGAIGAGLDLATGQILHAAHRNRSITHHVDTGEPIVGFTIPDWSTALRLAARASDVSELGYVGVDLVVDAERGALLLELNARPGLAIQIAHLEGLLPRLRKVEEVGHTQGLPVVERCQLARSLFGRHGC
jgi:alpha-L-glutamate ligase-like protein